MRLEQRLGLGQGAAHASGPRSGQAVGDQNGMVVAHALLVALGGDEKSAGITSVPWWIS